MSIGQLTLATLSKALEIYYPLAYPGGNVPSNRQQFQTVAQLPDLDALWQVKGVQQLEPRASGEPGGYALRVGNAWYPHMKIMIQPYDADPGYAFAVNTHDRLFVPEGSPEADAIRELQMQNQELARNIERQWEAHGLPTQTGLLRSYLKSQGTPTSLDQ